MTFQEELATAAAVWNSFHMVREQAESRVRKAEAEAKEARTNEERAYTKFLDLARTATLEPVSVR